MTRGWISVAIVAMALGGCGDEGFSKKASCEVGFAKMKSCKDTFRRVAEKYCIGIGFGYEVCLICSYDTNTGATTCVVALREKPRPWF